MSDFFQIHQAKLQDVKRYYRSKRRANIDVAFVELEKRIQLNRANHDQIEIILRDQRGQIFQDPEDLESNDRRHGNYEQSTTQVEIKLNVLKRYKEDLIRKMVTLRTIQTEFDRALRQSKEMFEESLSYYVDLCQTNMVDRFANDRLIKRNLCDRIGLLTAINEPMDATLAGVSNENRAGIDAADANIDAVLNERIARLQRSTNEHNHMVKKLSQHVCYNFGNGLRRLQAALKELVKQHRDYREKHADRIKCLEGKFLELSDCLNAQLDRLNRQSNFKFSPHLMMDATNGSLFYLMDRIDGPCHVSTRYHTLASIILRAALLLLGKCPIVVMDSFNKIFDQPIITGVEKYFVEMIKDQHMQLMYMITTPPKQLDSVRSVHLMWEQSLVCICTLHIAHCYHEHFISWAELTAISLKCIAFVAVL